MIRRAASCQLEEISISTLLTFALLRFLADLSAGLTEFTAGAVGEERRGDSRCNCEACNKTINNTDDKIWSRAGVAIKEDFRKSCNNLGKHCHEIPESKFQH